MTGGRSRGEKMAVAPICRKTQYLLNKTNKSILFFILFPPYEAGEPLSELEDGPRFIYFNICSCEALTSGSGSMTICHVPHTYSLVFQKIPITLYWIVKRLLRLCFLQMLRARWISLDSGGKPPRSATVIYESPETGSSSCYCNRHLTLKTSSRLVKFESRVDGHLQTLNAVFKIVLFVCAKRIWKREIDSYAVFLMGVLPWKCFQMNPWP